MTTSSHERADVYVSITDQIIAAIEAGADHPQMPWHSQGSIIERPVNVASQRAYRGVNTVALWAAAYCQQFTTGLWGTYRQWQEKGAQVRKGEKSSVIIFYKDVEPGEQDQSASNDDERGNRRFIARASRVFNVAQVDGFTMPAIDENADAITPCERAEQLVAASGALLVAGSSLVVNSGVRLVERARRRRLPVVIVNRGATRADRRASVKIDAGTTEVLQELTAALLAR